MTRTIEIDGKQYEDKRTPEEIQEFESKILSEIKSIRDWIQSLDMPNEETVSAEDTEDLETVIAVTNESISEEDEIEPPSSNTDDSFNFEGAISAQAKASFLELFMGGVLNASYQEKETGPLPVSMPEEDLVPVIQSDEEQKPELEVNEVDESEEVSSNTDTIEIEEIVEIPTNGNEPSVPVNIEKDEANIVVDTPANTDEEVDPEEVPAEDSREEVAVDTNQSEVVVVASTHKEQNEPSLEERLSALGGKIHGARQDLEKSSFSWENQEIDTPKNETDTLQVSSVTFVEQVEENTAKKIMWYKEFGERVRGVGSNFMNTVTSFIENLPESQKQAETKTIPLLEYAPLPSKENLDQELVSLGKRIGSAKQQVSTSFSWGDEDIAQSEPIIQNEEISVPEVIIIPPANKEKQKSRDIEDQVAGIFASLPPMLSVGVVREDSEPLVIPSFTQLNNLFISIISSLPVNEEKRIMYKKYIIKNLLKEAYQCARRGEDLLHIQDNIDFKYVLESFDTELRKKKIISFTLIVNGVDIVLFKDGEDLDYKKARQAIIEARSSLFAHVFPKNPPRDEDPAVKEALTGITQIIEGAAKMNEDKDK